MQLKQTKKITSNVPILKKEWLFSDHYKNEAGSQDEVLFNIPMSSVKSISTMQAQVRGGIRL